MPALSDKDIGWFDIAMNDALGVGRVECVGDFDGYGKQHFGFHRPPPDSMLQSQTIEELHGNEGMTLVLANVMNGADIRMIQGGSSLRFTLETGQRLRIFGYFIGQEFQGNEAAQASIFGFVNHAHSAAPELLDDAIVRDGLADQWGTVRPPA